MKSLTLLCLCNQRSYIMASKIFPHFVGMYFEPQEKNNKVPIIFFALVRPPYVRTNSTRNTRMHWPLINCNIRAERLMDVLYVVKTNGFTCSSFQGCNIDTQFDPDSKGMKTKSFRMCFS